jgi:hypothetical protein
MFGSDEQAQRLMMCDDCRVIVQFDAPDVPLAGPPRPKTRTTDDYLREREIEEARAKLLEERAQGGGDAKGKGAGNGTVNGTGGEPPQDKGS